MTLFLSSNTFSTKQPIFKKILCFVTASETLTSFEIFKGLTCRETYMTPVCVRVLTKTNRTTENALYSCLQFWFTFTLIWYMLFWFLALNLQSIMLVLSLLKSEQNFQTCLCILLCVLWPWIKKTGSKESKKHEHPNQRKDFEHTMVK